MASKNTVILNDYNGRKGKIGKGRVSVEVTAEPLIHNFDEKKLGKGPAEAIRDAVEKAIKTISEQAASSTLAKRRAQGISSSKLFNATGRLARFLRVAETRDGYETRSAPDRLVRLPADVIRRLFETAEIEAEDLVKIREVKAAIQESVGVLVTKGRKR